MTVSRVINSPDVVSASTRDAVLHAMDELGYVPNRAARSLVVRRLGVIALVLPDLSNPFFSDMARAVEVSARDRELTVTLGNAAEDVRLEHDYVRTVGSLRVDGVLLAPVGDPSRPSIELLDRLGIPVVLIDRKVRGVERDVVRGESLQASIDLTTHVIEHGHRRVGMVAGPRHATTARDRVVGWRRALRQRGVDASKDLVRYADYTRAGGREAGRSLLCSPDPPTAIFAGNNFLAFGVLDAASELGLRVPDDLALVTFDDAEVTPTEPLLTCADQPAAEIGRTAARLLLERMEDPSLPPREFVLPSEIRLRRSCGCTR